MLVSWGVSCNSFPTGCSSFSQWVFYEARRALADFGVLVYEPGLLFCCWSTWQLQYFERYHNVFYEMKITVGATIFSVDLMRVHEVTRILVVPVCWCSLLTSNTIPNERLPLVSTVTMQHCFHSGRDCGWLGGWPGWLTLFHVLLVPTWPSLRPRRKTRRIATSVSL